MNGYGGSSLHEAVWRCLDRQGGSSGGEGRGHGTRRVRTPTPIHPSPVGWRIASGCMCAAMVSPFGTRSTSTRDTMALMSNTAPANAAPTIAHVVKGNAAGRVAGAK